MEVVDENNNKEDNCVNSITANDSSSSGIEDNQEENDVIIIISDEEENNETRMKQFIGTTKQQNLILTFKRTVNIVNGQEHWKPFVEIDEVTQEYKGLTIELLKELSNRLNFTYELIHPPDGNWGVASNDNIWNGLLGQLQRRNSELPERRKLWNGILKFNQSDPSVLSSDPAEQIGKVRGGNYAYIGDRTYLDMAIGQSCDMSFISNDDFHPLLVALPLPNNSPFLKVFSDEIVAIIETGLIQTWMLKTWPKPENCEETSITDAKSISVSDFQFAFYLTGIGLMLAVLSLIYEYIERKRYHWVVTHGRRQNEQRKIAAFKEI
ncbi:unnamed protein product [Mytilus coruscus]|uniref:Ionotropic glutamate receptor L-glutamate and glycine-binding domain-containing protein n=1 Tax=Mytilus coruscus TaxID=42192 RepID=A0A6J8BXJ1_MYTCO|nr:unnamed protein product [Mytilus coruscus]